MPIRLANTVYASKKPKSPLESAIQRKILDYLKVKGIFHFRVNTGGVMRMGRWTPSPNITKGVADIIAIKSEHDPICECQFGRFLAIEVKRPGLKPSEDQEKFLRSVTDAGGIAIVAYSLADVRAIFE
jgi:hypothetical protein